MGRPWKGAGPITPKCRQVWRGRASREDERMSVHQGQRRRRRSRWRWRLCYTRDRIPTLLSYGISLVERCMLSPRLKCKSISRVNTQSKSPPQSVGYARVQLRGILQSSTLRSAVGYVVGDRYKGKGGYAEGLQLVRCRPCSCSGGAEDEHPRQAPG